MSPRTMNEEKVMEIFMAIFLILITIAFCVVAISGELSSDKSGKENRSKIIVPFQIDKHNRLLFPF